MPFRGHDFSSLPASTGFCRTALLVSFGCSQSPARLETSYYRFPNSYSHFPVLSHSFRPPVRVELVSEAERPFRGSWIEVPGSLTGLVPSPPVYVWPVLPLTILSPLAAKSVQISPIYFKGAHQCRTLCGFEGAQIVRDRKRKMVDSESADFIMPTNPKFQNCRHRRDFRLNPRKCSRAEQVRVVQGND